MATTEWLDWVPRTGWDRSASDRRARHADHPALTSLPQFTWRNTQLASGHRFRFWRLVAMIPGGRWSDRLVVGGHRGDGWWPACWW